MLRNRNKGGAKRARSRLLTTMNAQGKDLRVKCGVAFVAVTFILSLPTWALGVILAVGFAAKVGIAHLRELERQDETPSAGREPGERHG